MSPLLRGLGVLVQSPQAIKPCRNSTSHSVPLTLVTVSANFGGLALRSLIRDSLVFIHPTFP